MVLQVKGIVIFYFLVLLTVPPILSEDYLEFLVEGETIEFTQKTRTDRLTIITVIDIDAISGREQITAIDGILKNWNNYPAFNEQTPDIGITYLSLTEKAVEDLIRTASLLDRVVLFKDKTNIRNATYPCTYKHDVLLLQEMQSQVNNLKTTLKKLDTSWTATEISTDISKDTALRHFATMLTETVENWLQSMNELLSTLDTLASNKIPEEVQGHYQEAPCIGNLFEESITVLDCYGTHVGYLCDIEITVPLAFKRMNVMLPVHYQDIRLRGQTVDQYFVKDISGKEIQLLTCNHYDFNKENIPFCELQDLEKNCNRAIVARDNTDIIHQCNFTKHQPTLAVRTFEGGILTQGTNVITKTQNTSDYTVLTKDSPVVVFSPVSIIVQKDTEELVFAPMDSQIKTKVITSKLTSKMISSLKSKYYWQTFMEDFDTEDLTRYVILLLQVILYPIALSGIALGLRARRNMLTKLVGQGKSNKHIYRANKMALKRLNK